MKEDGYLRTTATPTLIFAYNQSVKALNLVHY